MESAHVLVSMWRRKKNLPVKVKLVTSHVSVGGFVLLWLKVSEEITEKLMLVGSHLRFAPVLYSILCSG